MATIVDSRSNLDASPLMSFKFRVKISKPSSTVITLDDMGFTSVSGLAVQIPPFPFRQGGVNVTTARLPTQADSPDPVVLTRGVQVAAGKPQIFTWFEEIYYYLQGLLPPGAAKGTWDFRRTVDIQVLSHPWTLTNSPAIKYWIRLYSAWPTALSFSPLDAGTQAVFIESLSLTYEGFKVSYADDNLHSTATAPAQIVAPAKTVPKAHTGTGNSTPTQIPIKR